MNMDRASTGVTLKALLLLLFAAFLPAAVADQALRIVTWNVETIGEPGGIQYEAADAVLTRLGGDVVAIQEVASAADTTYIAQLAVDLGYANVTVAPAGPFGSLRAAILSDFPLLTSGAWSAADLSGDPDANDLTRYILSADIDVTGAGDNISVIVNHWKSGGTNTDEYRRAVESTRIAQVIVGIDDVTQPYVVMGDVNEDIGDGALTPAVFTEIASGLPTAFVTGADIATLLNTTGLLNDPFGPVIDWAVLLDAEQVDTDDATRPASGRRLDYIFASANLSTDGVQVYDCADEALGLGLPLVGDPLEPAVCASASDHLPVFADVRVPTDALDCPPDGHLVVAQRTLSGSVPLTCDSISLGPDLAIATGAQVSLRASTSVIMRPGTAIARGATLNAVIDAGLTF
jgi:endonuclease/exonuclease/phosphatase family metal-dependent hydrolase